MNCKISLNQYNKWGNLSLYQIKQYPNSNKGKEWNKSVRKNIEKKTKQNPTENSQTRTKKFEKLEQMKMDPTLSTYQ